MYVLYTTPKETRQRPTRTLIATCTVVEICILNTGQRTYTVYWIQGNGNIDEYMFYTRKETPQKYISRKETCKLNTGWRTYTRIHVLYSITERDLLAQGRVVNIEYRERGTSILLWRVSFRVASIQLWRVSFHVLISQKETRQRPTSAWYSRVYWIQRKRHIHTTLTCFFPCSLCSDAETCRAVGCRSAGWAQRIPHPHFITSRCVAVRCSALQCIAVYCSVLPCVAVGCIEI